MVSLMDEEVCTVDCDDLGQSGDKDVGKAVAVDVVKTKCRIAQLVHWRGVLREGGDIVDQCKDARRILSVKVHETVARRADANKVLAAIHVKVGNTQIPHEETERNAGHKRGDVGCIVEDARNILHVEEKSLDIE